MCSRHMRIVVPLPFKILPSKDFMDKQEDKEFLRKIFVLSRIKYRNSIIH